MNEEEDDDPSLSSEATAPGYSSVGSLSLGPEATSAKSRPANGRTSREERIPAVNGMSDRELDAFFPKRVRRASRTFWSPVAVVRRTVAVLDGLGVRRVLDVGSGPGKFCIVGAAQSPHMTFVGVEQRASLVGVARMLAADLQIENATFRLGDATRVPWTDFDAFYVFNSFAENGFSADDQFDQTVELSRVRRVAEVMRVERWLAAMPVGTVLATYFGLGGPIPSSYERVVVEPAGTGWLQVWRKTSGGACDTYWLEEDGDAGRLTADDVSDRLLHEIDSEQAQPIAPKR